jgi:hypothetical protein
VAPHRGEYAGGAGCDVGIAVNLTVWVLFGDADLWTSVFKAVDLGNTFVPGECRGAVDPSIEDESNSISGERAKGTVVVRGEADHLAATYRGEGFVVSNTGPWSCGTSARERREPILKDDNVVVGFGNL